MSARKRSKDWSRVRDSFLLDSTKIHLASFQLSSHPATVRAAIDRHRKELDENPIEYRATKQREFDQEARRWAAEYLGGSKRQIALTDSTTMGLALTYSGMKLRPGDEVLSTYQDHTSTYMSLNLAASRSGARLKRISLYESAPSVKAEDMVARISDALGPSTRVVALTWVHSGTGVAIPVKEIAGAIRLASLRYGQKIFFCLDAVHAVGVFDFDVTKLGCDVLISGCHKWLCGPRGTGVVWANDRAWEFISPVIPPFSDAYVKYELMGRGHAVNPGIWATPGGYHSFEHRWALPETFAFHLDLGKSEVQQRIVDLNRELKQRVSRLDRVSLITPMADELSAGIVCIDVKGRTARAIIGELAKRNVVASVTPYLTEYVRLAAGIANDPQDVERAVAALGEIVATTSGRRSR